MGCAKGAATPRGGVWEDGIGGGCWLSPPWGDDRLYATGAAPLPRSSRLLAPPEALPSLNRGKPRAAAFGISVAGSPSPYRGECRAGVLVKGVRNTGPRSNAHRVPGFDKTAPPAGPAACWTGMAGHAGTGQAASCRQERGSSRRDRHRPHTVTGKRPAAGDPTKKRPRSLRFEVVRFQSGEVRTSPAAGSVRPSEPCATASRGSARRPRSP